jgi:hypothetical protein
VIHTRPLVIGAVFFAAISASAQVPIQDGAVFRVFLKDGKALPSYGESAPTGDRVVFTLIIGGVREKPALQLVSLPMSRIDVDRTGRYADAVRAAHYASTRGDVDYAAMTQEVQRAVTELAAVKDPLKRLELAQGARERLLSWARITYGYRSAEVRELVSLLDEVIAELSAATGQRSFTLDLRANTLGPEPLLPVPDAAESVALAMAAAAACDNDDERLAILQVAAKIAETLPPNSPVRLAATREFRAESTANEAYAALAAEIRAQAEAAKKKGDVAALTKMAETVQTRDQALGGRRPHVVSALLTELEAMVATTKTVNETLVRYTRVRAHLLGYERSIRPVLSGFDGLRPILNAIRETKYTSYDRLVVASERLRKFIETVALIQPPQELADVHATLASALSMADHACARRRLAVAIMSGPSAEQASSAAAGALLLLDQARTQLVQRLYPPKVQ